MQQPAARGRTPRVYHPPPPDDPTIHLQAPDAPAALFLAHAAGVLPIQPMRSLVLGSAAGVDLRLRDPYVSSRHAHLSSDGPRFAVEDLGSTNGTWIDGVRVHRAYLAPGMRLQLGCWRATVMTEAPRARLVEDTSPGGMVGHSPAFLEFQRSLQRLASLGQAVLVHGETGTGKELAARALHAQGPRAGGPFVAVNCGAIPDGLAESELFGHVRGAFTGAHRSHSGAFARAHGGTLFLDEIAELPLLLQAKLLRVLEIRRVCPVGGEAELPVDARVVAATHQNLGALASAGKFRSDLYHRLSVLQLEIPPLRQRRDDIPVLLHRFADDLAADLGRPVLLTADALSAAQLHDWPGNIRELRNALLRAAADTDGPITGTDLVPLARRSASVGLVAIPRGTYAEMHRALLGEVLREAGSIRRAAQQLAVPRSTLANWLRGLAPG